MKRKLIAAVIFLLTVLFSSNNILAGDHQGREPRHGFHDQRTIIYEHHRIRNPVIVERRTIVPYHEVNFHRQGIFFGFGFLWGSGPFRGRYTIENDNVCLHTDYGNQWYSIPSRGRYIVYRDVIIIHDRHNKVWVRRR